MSRYLMFAAALAFGFFGLAGCEKNANQAQLASKSPPQPSASGGHEGHDHDHGPHDGAVAEWDDYHAEFTVDHKTKTAVVYIVDESLKKAPKVDPAKIAKVTVTITNVQPPVTLELKHDGAKSDAKGIAFSGTHDAFAKEMEFQGSISGTVDGKPYSGEFKEKAEGHDHDKDKKKTELEGHPGGVHVAFAQGKHYAEALLHQDGSIHLFLFGKDLATVAEAEAQTIAAYVRPIGAKEFASFQLKPEPLEGDAKGFASRFAGQLPADLKGKDLEVMIPAVKIGGERYHLAFQTVEKPHEGDGAGGHVADKMMPVKPEDAVERALYLTPGGAYTLDDIKANGGVTASVKFKDFKAAHDLNPKPGEKICPVTLTKANPDCSWIVGGKKYEFCCPPCVDEFVKLAKEDPTAIKAPEGYVKK